MAYLRKLEEEGEELHKKRSSRIHKRFSDISPQDPNVRNNSQNNLSSDCRDRNFRPSQKPSFGFSNSGLELILKLFPSTYFLAKMGLKIEYLIELRE